MTSVPPSWKNRNVNHKKRFSWLFVSDFCHYSLNNEKYQERRYLIFKKRERKKHNSRYKMSRRLLDLAFPDSSFSLGADEDLRTVQSKQTICFIHYGSLIQKHSRLTSIFQMFRLESRSQQKFPFLSTPLNPKPAALFTASAMVFKTTH